MSNDEFEQTIVPTTWDDKDTDIVVQYKLDKKLGLENKPELQHDI